MCVTCAGTACDETGPDPLERKQHHNARPWWRGARGHTIIHTFNKRNIQFFSSFFRSHTKMSVLSRLCTTTRWSLNYQAEDLPEFTGLKGQSHNIYCSVADPHWFQCGSGSSLLPYLNAGPDPGSQTNADPDPGQTLPSLKD